MSLPEATQEPIIHVDATPDETYPLRILRAYRQNCDCRWVSTEPNPLIDMMNEACDKRAILLDRAIAVLEEVLIVRKALPNDDLYILRDGIYHEAPEM